jgi:hypothetical protein
MHQTLDKFYLFKKLFHIYITISLFENNIFFLSNGTNKLTGLLLGDGFRVLQIYPLKRISSSRLGKASKKTKEIYGYS